MCSFQQCEHHTCVRVAASSPAVCAGVCGPSVHMALGRWATSRVSEARPPPGCAWLHSAGQSVRHDTSTLAKFDVLSNSVYSMQGSGGAACLLCMLGAVCCGQHACVRVAASSPAVHHAAAGACALLGALHMAVAPSWLGRLAGSVRRVLVCLCFVTDN
jgi:hypothetical protein